MIRNVAAVIAGFVVASMVMLTCEYINHLFFPFPPDMDTQDIAQVRAFALTLPWHALVLVGFGWTTGSFFGGAVTTWIAGNHAVTAVQVLGVLLTAGGLFNAWLIQEPAWFFAGGLPTFFVFSVLGHLAARRN